MWHASATGMDGAAREMPTVQELIARARHEFCSKWTMYVARGDGLVVGMIALGTVERMLDQLFVAPGRQSEGVGGALLSVAKRDMPDGFHLRVASANGLAIGFYERAGLTVVSSGHHPRSGSPVTFLAWVPGSVDGGRSGREQRGDAGGRRADVRLDR